MTSRPPEDKPKWKNLIDCKCPKCGTLLIENKNAFMFVCESQKCDFKISQEAFNRTVKQIYKGFGRTPRQGDDQEALEFLNNYGRTKESADFSGDTDLGEGYTV